jgi:hypothetical protein
MRQHKHKKSVQFRRVAAIQTPVATPQFLFEGLQKERVSSEEVRSYSQNLAWTQTQRGELDLSRRSRGGVSEEE